MRQQPASEDALQAQCVDLLAYCLPPDVFWTAIQPRPFKSKAAAGMAKRLGAKAGIPDIIVLCDGEFIGIELKNGKAGRQSVQQKARAREIFASGGKYFVARSVDEFVDILRDCGVPLRDMVVF